jgi:hypothetical protein
MAEVGGDLRDDGYYFSLGIEYRQELSGATGERYAGLFLPIWFAVPVTSWLALKAGVAPNLLLLGGGGDTGLRKYSPLSAGVVLDLGRRIYLEAGASHHLGAGSSEPLHADFALGVRL